ncbi:EF-hand and coiled-coil domain-containing protein 1 [Erinaceus europaeus]|uniref:EF-hand and coiled-coil domain-containing protein 1 n=1 Tax=Erinaceus europaeus TaxID=9365 RepID=A0ABM3WTM3_ERIEU|nr:EF-hand and coiled-coil domain-containing protein 1 [Erinaceus europaeus]
MEPSGAEGAAGDPYRRPARRTQWLLSALAHHYGLDRGVENEIVVLATGLDQYLQEVFHHLDCRGAGRLPRADFRALCAVLGLRAEGTPGEAAGGDAGGPGGAAGGDADADAQEEARLALSAEPPELTFRQFHARLCGYFGSRAGPRLPRGALSEHIETQIRLRRPRRRRPPPRASSPDGSPDGIPDGERWARLQEENGSLRELVEDLRAALQSSDARCLALQVGLWKSQAGAREAGRGGPEPEPEPEPARELRQARGALAAAEARAGRLRRGQAEVRWRAEEARQAVLRSLRRVRELEALAGQVPALQRCVQRLESELRRYRSEDTQPPASEGSLGPEAGSGEPADCAGSGPDTRAEGASCSDSSSSQSRALDKARASPAVDEQLFRSVEGQAASDEEKEEEGEKRPPAEVKKLLAGLSSCGSWCDDQTAKVLLAYFSHFGSADHAQALGELDTHMAMLVEQRGTPDHSRKTQGPPGEQAALQQKEEESERLRLELHMVETERVRLSLLEEKLVDVLQLLQRLRDLNISKRALGKILLSTLDACRDLTHEETSGPSAILDALHKALAGCELLRKVPLAPASAAPVPTNSVLISC